MCHMCHTQSLGLGDNQIGDAGVTALAEACARGAMARLKSLFLDYGPLGEEHPAIVAACEARGIDLLN